MSGACDTANPLGCPRRCTAPPPLAAPCRALQRLQDATLRGLVAGLSLRGGLHLVSYVLNLLVRRRRQTAKWPDALEMLKDTARWGAFLGSFSGDACHVICRRAWKQTQHLLQRA
jgi:hypothetical protein